MLKCGYFLLFIAVFHVRCGNRPTQKRPQLRISGELASRKSRSSMPHRQGICLDLNLPGEFDQSDRRAVLMIAQYLGHVNN